VRLDAIVGHAWSWERKRKTAAVPIVAG